MSEPQLRKDINKLQEKLRAAQARILDLESRPPREVVKTVIKEVPVDVVKEVIKTVPGPIQYVDREVVVHVKDPKQAQIIKQLQAKLKGV